MVTFNFVSYIPGDLENVFLETSVVKSQNPILLYVKDS